MRCERWASRAASAGVEGGSMRRFHHVGVITDRVQPGEIYVAETKVHVTNPADHPYRVEYLRFEPDSPVTGPVRGQPHMAFAVDDLEAEIAGEQVLLGPCGAMEGLRVAFILRDGASSSSCSSTPSRRSMRGDQRGRGDMSGLCNRREWIGRIALGTGAALAGLGGGERPC